MPLRAPLTPLLLIGAGHMGGALIEGWTATGAIAPADLIIVDPKPGAAGRAAVDKGAKLNPDEASLGQAPTVVLALKPQIWRDAAHALAPHLAAEAVVISIMAGVGVDDLANEFGGRVVGRVMPNIAAAIGKGVAGVYAPAERARSLAHVLFEPIATIIDLPDEVLLHAVTAVGGSGPAYLYAFTEALAAAAQTAGLAPEAAARLARATVVGAADLMAGSDKAAAELRRQVSSPGGTTEAALRALLADDGLGPLLERAVALAAARSEALGG